MPFVQVPVHVYSFASCYQHPVELNQGVRVEDHEKMFLRYASEVAADGVALASRKLALSGLP